PAITGDSIFAVTNNAELISIKKATGQIHWAVSLPKLNENKTPILWAGPIIAGDSLILAGSNGELVFASPKDGKILKTINMPGGSGLSPIVADEALYVLTDDATLVKYAKEMVEEKK